MRDYDGLAYIRQVVEGTFYFAQFDTETANLDLMVDAAQKIQWADSVVFTE